MKIKKKMKMKIMKIKKNNIFGDWGLGIGDWGLGIGDWANPQSPIFNIKKINIKNLIYLL